VDVYVTMDQQDLKAQQRLNDMSKVGPLKSPNLGNQMGVLPNLKFMKSPHYRSVFLTN